MSVQLTNISEAGKPPYPISINPNHVVELKPCYRPLPNRGSQVGGLMPSFQGSQLRLVTGDYVRVVEDYEVAHSRLWPTSPRSFSIRQGNIAGLQEALADKSEPIKKTPAKKSSPKVVDPAPVPTPNEDKTVAEPAAEQLESEEKDEV